MGKNLIIKGADFSANAVSDLTASEWVFGFTDAQLESLSVSNLAVANFKTYNNLYNDGNTNYLKLQGTISKVRLYNSRGEFTNNVKLYRIPIASIDDESSANLLVTVPFSGIGIKEITLDTPIEIGAGYYLAWNANDATTVKYSQSGNASLHAGFHFSTSNLKNAAAAIDFYSTYYK